MHTLLTGEAYTINFRTSDASGRIIAEHATAALEMYNKLMEIDELRGVLDGAMLYLTIRKGHRILTFEQLWVAC